MPGKVKVKIVAGRNLPVMDRSSDTTDAYVEIKLGNTTFKTDVCRKSLNPQWNSEWYRFEMDDAELQDEPLQIRLMDHDTYSANDAIGKVYLDLNPLLLPPSAATTKTLPETGPASSISLSGGSTMSGWFPVYDTMHGIRGEVNVIVKVELFSDFNKFRQSSCGVQFFNSSVVPQGHHAQTILGLVEELVVDDDPEYQWIDKIRTPRASNEARQTLFFKLSGEVQRKIGLKVLDLGGNAVIGYLQCFDLEGESGIVVRGIGTAVTLVKLYDQMQPPPPPTISCDEQTDNRVIDISKLSGSPYLSIIPATPHEMSPMSSPQMGLLIPKSPKLRHSRSPFVRQHSQPMGKKPKKQKHTALSTQSLTDSTSIFDDVSLKSLFEQEDMRGESSSSSQRLFHAISSFPRKKIRALKTRSKVGYTRSKSDTVTSALIRSIIDNRSFLDRVSESDEHRTQDKDSILDLRYDDGHLIPTDSQSSSDCSSSDIEDISSASSTTQEVLTLDFDAEQIRHDKILSKKTPFDFSITSDTIISEKKLDDNEENITVLELKPSTVHVLADLNSENGIKTFSNLVQFDSSPKCLRKSSINLLRQKSFDETFVDKKLKRSNTPPLSEMDPYMKFSLDDKMNYQETFFTNNSSMQLTVSSPSFEDESKSVQNHPINTPELITFETNPLSEHVFKTVHTINLDNTLYDEMPIDETTDIENDVIEITGANFCDLNQYPKASTLPLVSDENDPEDVIFIPLSPSDHSSCYPKTSDTTTPMDRDVDGIIVPLKSSYDIHRSVIRSPSEHNVQDGILIPLKPPNNSDTRNTNHHSSDNIFKDKKLIFSKHRIERDNKLSQSDNQEIFSTSSKSIEGLVIPLKSSNSVLMCSMPSNGQNVARDSIDDSVFIPLKPPDHSVGNTSTLSEKKVSSLHSDDDDTMKDKVFISSKPSLDHPVKIPLFEEVEFPPFNNAGNTIQDVNVCTKLTKPVNSVTVAAIFSDNSIISSTPDRRTSVIIPLKPYNQVDHNNDNMFSPVNVISAKLESNDDSITAIPSVSLPECAPDTNLTLLQPHPLIKSRSDSGLVEPWQSSAPPSRLIAEDVQPITNKNSQSPAKLNSVQGIHRRSSDSDLSITPKGNSLTSSDRSSLAGGGGRVFHGIFHRPTMYKETLDMLEYPFLTMSKYPPGFIVHIGGTVSARSVKLLERITNLEEPESRDSWWTELRMEVRSHARALACNVVLGYSEHSAICDDVCVLSASGTAAVISVRGEGGVLNLSGNAPVLSDTPEPATSIVTKQFGNMTTSLDRSDFERQGSLTQTTPIKPDSDSGKARHISESGDPPPESPLPPCAVCHIPYNVTSVPFSVNITKCSICRRGKVSDVLLTTIEPPENLPVAGRCCLLQAFVCRPKRDCRGELNAKDISDGLPFLEYELHSQLLNKLKVNGMNAIFRLRTQVCLGERMIAALATGTAVLLAALPVPPVPTITAGNAWKDEGKLSEIQKQLQDTIKKNREYYQLKISSFNTSQEGDTSTKGRTSDTEDSDDDMPDVDLTTGSKDTCILEVDDAEDAHVISQLIDAHPPEGFHVMASEHIPGLEDLEVVTNLQMFTQVWRSRIPPNVQMTSLNKHFHRLLQGVYFKLRRMTPCAIGNIRFRVELPEPDEMQISLVGMALGLGEVDKSRHLRRKLIAQPGSKDLGKRSDEGDMIFCLEEDQESNGSNHVTSKPARPRSPIVRPPRKSNHVSPKEHYGVDMSPLSFIPGGKIERYLGNLNFFFIRESSCIREGGGLSGFVHSFVAEVLAIVRAHVTALGGNAMVAFFMNECILLNNPHKNHGQCLINIGGDAVFVNYHTGE